MHVMMLSLWNSSTIRNLLWARQRAQSYLWSMIAGLVFCSGCGGSGNPPTVPISGTVVYKGAPLTTGKVRFNPADPKSGRPAEGVIQPDGSFTVETFKPGDGALAGEYGISLIPMAEQPGELAKKISDDERKKRAFPEKYANPKTSGLKETVTLGKPKKDLKLELTD